MNCQSTRERFPDLLDPRIASAPSSSAELDAARTHLAQCPDCQREFARLSQTLAALDGLKTPPPSPALRKRFHAMLAEEKAAEHRPTPGAHRPLRHFSLWQWVLAPFAACGLVLAGFVAGTQRAPVVSPQTNVLADAETRRELQELRSKVDRMETMNQFVSVAYQQQQQPANDRFRGVLTSASQENPSDRLINELITSLALDSSSNVRLRALEALYQHADREVVRAGVLASLTREPNPLVQVAMIDFLAAARDREAKPALERMSADDLADGTVREAARRALAQL